MIYIVCDMNCNNFGNYFKVIGHEREVTKDEDGNFYKDATHYPRMQCYRIKEFESPISFPYSVAIDFLIPEDYVRWQKTRFGGLK